MTTNLKLMPILSKYRLPNQLPGEEIIQIVRRDSFVLFRKVLFFILLALVPFIFLVIVINVFPGLLEGSLSYPALVLGSSAFYLFIWLFFFFSFIDYYLDIWIITSERIIDVRQEGFFSRVIAEQRLYRVQDVTSEIHGVFPTIFNFGDVYIQTAGEVQRFLFHEVPNPEIVRDTIAKLMERAHNRIENADQPSSGGIAPITNNL